MFQVDFHRAERVSFQRILRKVLAIVRHKITKLQRRGHDWLLIELLVRTKKGCHVGTGWDLQLPSFNQANVLFDSLDCGIRVLFVIRFQRPAELPSDEPEDDPKVPALSLLFQ